MTPQVAELVRWQRLVIARLALQQHLHANRREQLSKKTAVFSPAGCWAHNHSCVVPTARRPRGAVLVARLQVIQHLQLYRLVLFVQNWFLSFSVRKRHMRKLALNQEDDAIMLSSVILVHPLLWNASNLFDDIKSKVMYIFPSQVELKVTSTPHSKHVDSHGDKEVPLSRRQPFCACTRPLRGDHQLSLCASSPDILLENVWFARRAETPPTPPLHVDFSHPSTRHSLCSIRRVLAEAARLSRPRVIGLRGGGLGATGAVGAAGAAGATGAFLWAEQTSQAPQPPNGLCGVRKRCNYISAVNRAAF